MFSWPWLRRALGFGSLKQLGLCPSTRKAGVGGKDSSRAGSFAGSGLSPAFQETHVVVSMGLVPKVVVRGLLLATLPASLW